MTGKTGNNTWTSFYLKYFDMYNNFVLLYQHHKVSYEGGGPLCVARSCKMCSTRLRSGACKCHMIII